MIRNTPLKNWPWVTSFLGNGLIYIYIYRQKRFYHLFCVYSFVHNTDTYIWVLLVVCVNRQWYRQLIVFSLHIYCIWVLSLTTIIIWIWEDHNSDPCFRGNVYGLIFPPAKQCISIHKELTTTHFFLSKLNWNHTKYVIEKSPIV